MVVVGAVVVVDVVEVVEVVGGAELTTGTRAVCGELLHATITPTAPINRAVRRDIPPG